MCSADIFLGLLAILFPPLPVWVKCGICSADSLINILLCVLGYIPGLLHAWYIIAKYPEPAYEYETLPQDGESGRVRYVIIRDSAGAQTSPPPQQGRMSYGTTGNQASGAPPPQESGVRDAAGGSSATPPSYAEVVAGDHKVQSRE